MLDYSYQDWCVLHWQMKLCFLINCIALWSTGCNAHGFLPLHFMFGPCAVDANNNSNNLMD